MSATEAEAIKNVTEELANATLPSSPEGQAIAYSSLVIMALIPIFMGSFRSITAIKEQKDSGEKPEIISRSDAMKFPLFASATLFGIYIFFKIFSQEYINILISVYFFILGVFALTHIAGPFISSLIPASFPNASYTLNLGETIEDKTESVIDMKFDRKDLVGLACSVAVAVWYTVNKHWIANNLLGLAFAMNGIEMIRINSIGTGCILLGGLFFYDVFWVFGTDVMVTVAKNFNAPIKVIFPQDFLEHGIFGSKFAMLGLGDIVIPGIFIALLLRFDLSLKRDQKTYFYTCFLAYFLGLVTTILVMVVFQHAQPALLYLVPYCIGFPVAVALMKGDLKAMFDYTDEEEEKQEEVKDETEKKEE